jgi:hypothetical protein
MQLPVTQETERRQLPRGSGRQLPVTEEER